MKNQAHTQVSRHTVAGISATAPRPTALAATLVATAIALPVGSLLFLIELLLL